MPTAAPVSEDFQNLRAAQQKVLRSLEVAGELLLELSKLGDADQALVQRQCEEYLQNLQEVQKTVIPAIDKYSNRIAHEGSSQLARAQMNAAQKHLEALLEGGGGEASKPPADEDAAVAMDTS